jgi:hypothetical protein
MALIFSIVPAIRSREKDEIFSSRAAFLSASRQEIFYRSSTTPACPRASQE